MMRKSLLALLFACFAIFLLGQAPLGQTLRGSVMDADSGKPLAGVNISLLKNGQANGASTNESGYFAIESIAVGRYQVQFTHLGYESLTIAEVLVESGREVVLNVQLREQPSELQAVVVKATSNAQVAPSIGRLNFSVEEQFRFPGTNFDPARLATAYPGVRGENDGTNIISVRGNSPNALQWRLEGVEIVNPNHTANAGTFGDRPTAAGGGVNILSAQLLGTSSMLTGAFPAQYGNSLGSIMDMSFRKGNDQRHELIAQAGFIGIEAAAEGPISVGSSAVGKEQSPSFLVNYRYSFTGLLSAMGVDFGEEASAFQDVAFHVALPGKKGGNFSVFGVGGNSSNVYRSPTDSATIDKERFNIDFQSKMGAAGMSYTKPMGQRSVWRTVAVLSALEHARTADLVASGERWEDDLNSQRKLGLLSILSKKISARLLMKIGVEAAINNDKINSSFKNDFVNFTDGIDTASWLAQPFIDWRFTIGKTEIEAGLHASVYSTDSKLLEPRLRISQLLGRAGILTLAYGKHSQRHPSYVLASGYLGKPSQPTVAHHLVLGHTINLDKSLTIKTEAYAATILNVPTYQNGINTFISTLNFSDFSKTYLGVINTQDKIRLLSTESGGLNYGLDLSIQKYITDKFFYLVSGSLYRSAHWTGISWGTRVPKESTRFDGRYTFNLTTGREFSKQKNGKTIINGISGRVAWLGGFREPLIDTAASAAVGYTVFQLVEQSPESRAFSFSEKLDDYFRIDLRFYKKWNKAGRNSMLSLDIQNITGRENIQYHYFDSVQGKVVEKRQLGLIPILTWRGEF